MKEREVEVGAQRVFLKLKVSGYVWALQSDIPHQWLVIFFGLCLYIVFFCSNEKKERQKRVVHRRVLDTSIHICYSRNIYISFSFSFVCIV